MTATWSVYLVRCREGSLYTGIATDVPRRLAEHREGKGAKYLRGRAPLQLEFAHTIGDRETALKVERRIKRLDRASKEALIDETHRIEPILAAARET